MTAVTETFETDDPRVLHALRVADQVHRFQTDKLGAPYMDHVRRVVARVAAFAPAEISTRCQIAAALHDVIEDGSHLGWDRARLEAEGFDAEVLDAVESVSKRGGEAYDDMVRRAGANPIGRWVKLADNRDNSDPVRAAALEPAERERLAAKYAGARRILAEYGATDV